MEYIDQDPSKRGIVNYVTDEGRKMIAFSLAKGRPMTFTKGEIGRGLIPETADARKRTCLIDRFATCEVTRVVHQNGQLEITLEHWNTDIHEYQHIYEIGIYATCYGKTALFSYLTMGDYPDAVLSVDDVGMLRVYTFPFIFDEGTQVRVTFDPSTWLRSDRVSDGSEFPDGMVRTSGLVPCIAGDGLLHVDIAGSARYLRDANGNLYGPEHFAASGHGHPIATAVSDGFMSKGMKVNMDTLSGYIDQSLRTDKSPSFSNLSMSGKTIRNARYR